MPPAFGQIMSGDTTSMITYAILGLSLLAMIWFMTNRGRANLAKARAEAEPKIAGEDQISGGAINPEQFDEPDEDALEEMAALLGEEE